MVGINTVVPKIQRYYVCVAGNASVGKTALLQVLISGVGNFPRNYAMTLGVETTSKTLPLSSTSAVEFVLVEGGGDELYRDLAARCWPTSCLLCLVFDCTNQQSFDDLDLYWIRKLQTSRASSFSGLLIANKIDQMHRRVVSEKQAQQFAKQHNLLYFECSAKDNTQVFEAFKSLALQFHSKN